MMTPYEKWHFDMMGYIVLPKAVPAADIARMKERGNEWAALPDEKLPKPMSTYAKPAFDPTKTRALNYVEYVDPVFQRALLNKEIMRVVLTLTDNCPQVLLASLQVYPANGGPGALHSGSEGGIHNPANYYQAAGDRVFATFLNVGVCVSDSVTGDGFVCLPGSHKSNFRYPDEITVDTPEPLVIAPKLRAGDVVIFTELLRHGGRNWQQPEPRMVLYTRYCTSYASWSVNYRALPEYAHMLPPDLVELMEPMGFQNRKKVTKRLLEELGAKT
ncbi:MAG: phytanoyl-CoA dioxygenase family protein [Planctomycetes bacterium]|nr:phytanoyl-CoA dioxygenase family protein [Planctomycetota bacterium]